MNPIFIKEFRGRMRGKKAFLIQVCYIIILSFVLFMVYYDQAHNRSGMNVMGMSKLGRTLFSWLMMTQISLIIFICPGFTCGSISAEKEKQTFDLILVTLLKPSNIINGKFFTSLFYIIILMFISVPLLSMLFIFGGVSPLELGLGILVLLITSLTFGMIGLFWSSMFPKTYLSTISTYLTTLSFSFGTIFLGVLLDEVFRILNEDLLATFIFPFSPITAMMSVISPDNPDFTDNIKDVIGVPIPMWGMNLALYTFILLILWRVLINKFYYFHRER
jgi:ABC-type transport system involved in multi-copper enzyme maturation permease subunit